MLNLQKIHQVSACCQLAHPFYREFADKLDTTSVASLPDMQGSGKVRDLQEAANDDEWRTVG